MNLPMSWLKEFVPIDCDVNEFCDKMTLSGSKVESITKVGADIQNVVVGKIVSITKHPDAEKLVVTSIHVGKEEPIQIVTGAKNVFEGAFVPVALDGSTLSNGVKIKKGNLRGVESNGMLCSIEELGFDRIAYPEAPEDGIYIFQNTENLTLGEDVVPLLQLAEEIVEFEITSNRPDCFSIIGLAREASATFDKPLHVPPISLKEEADGDIHELISVEIKNPALCPRYIARVVKNVKIESSPLWLRHRLVSAGIRPINNIVDITNYVMLEYGQPMHAFDISSIDDKKIIVRNAVDGEKFTTLDEVERTLDASMLVIADPNKAVAIAGVMGGQNSKTGDTASTILFESANFNGTNIRLTSKKLGLRTDSSSKYEKGLDPDLALLAVNRAVELVEKLGCGEVVKSFVDCYPEKRVENEVAFTAEGINKLLGTKLSYDEMVSYLNKLEIKVEHNKAIAPTFRPDLVCEADIAEEVARIYGYDKIETTLAVGTPTVGKKSYGQILEDIIKEVMIGQGVSEALTYSFESPKVFDKLQIPKEHNLREAVTITNPLGEDFSVMRTTTLNGMLQSLSINFNRRNEEASLFELNKIYLPKALPLTELPDERVMLTIGMYGKKDFYDLKGIVEELCNSLGISATFKVQKELSFMHPGRTSDVFADNQHLGFLGEVHPAVLNNYDIETKVYVAVLDVCYLTQLATLDRTYKALPKFPGTSRDIAMIVADSVFVSEIEDIIKSKGGKLLESITLFDVYKGKQIEEGFKSIAYNISFRSPERTLTDEEVQTVMKKILTALETVLNAKLRDK